MNTLAYGLFGVLGVLALFGFGGFLLYDSLSVPVSQSWEVIGGSTLLSLGLVLLYGESAWFLRWRRAMKSDNEHRRGLKDSAATR